MRPTGCALHCAHPMGESARSQVALCKTASAAFGDLRIAASLHDAAVLARKLQDFRVRFTENGNATFNAREGAHDDLVLALALAVFGLSRPELATDLKVNWASR